MVLAGVDIYIYIYIASEQKLTNFSRKIKMCKRENPEKIIVEKKWIANDKSRDVNKYKSRY